MTQSGSYNVASFSTNTEAEIRRLNAQVDLFWATESLLLQKYGLRDNMEVLDCGCGPGRLIELLKERMPGLRCTGLEMDPKLVEVAASLMKKRGFNDCHILQGTAEHPGLEESFFDFIILRLVLEHVTDPVAALKSLGRLLRKGGRIIVIDNDFEYHLRTWPAVPELDRLYEAYCASRSHDGGDPCIGRRLPQHLMQAELNVAGFEIEIAHSSALGDNHFLKAEGGGIPAQLVQSGFLDEKTLEDMTRSWRAMLKEPGHTIMRPLFVAVGEKAGKPVKLSTDRTVPIKDAALSETIVPEKNAVSGLEGTFAVVQAIVADVLRDKLQELGKSVIRPEDSLIELGMDSLAALELQERIKASVGIDIPLQKLLDDLSLGNLTGYIDDELTRRGSKQNTTAAGPQVPQTKSSWEEGEI